MPIVDPLTGEVSTAEIFVAVLGASSLTYAEATWTQTLPDWIGAHVRMFRFWGATPRLLVPDTRPARRPRSAWHSQGSRDLADNRRARHSAMPNGSAFLLERESTLRQQKRFEGRAKDVKLRHLAAVEDVDYRTPRGLDRAMFPKLTSCDWIRERRHCLLTGPAGVGKSWLACALGYKACRDNFCRCSINVCRGCLPRWRWLATTAGMPGC